MINYKEYLIYDLIQYIDQQINNTQILINETEQRMQQLKKIKLEYNTVDLFSNINILENTKAYKKIQLKKDYEKQIDDKLSLLTGHINIKFSSYEDKQMYLDNYVNNNDDNLQINTHANYELQTQDSEELLNQIKSDQIENLKQEQNNQAIETDQLDQLTDDQKEQLQHELLKEQEELELQQQVEEQLAVFYKKEHPEQTLPDFNIETIIEKYNITPLMHEFNIKEQTEYEATNESHISFISDYFPVNNIGISSLIKNVRKNIKNNDLNNSIIEIYKYWLIYLKNNNINYHQYDWRRFNDEGEFIVQDNQQYNDSILDEFICNINQSIIMYDEVIDKDKREQEFHNKMEKLLLSNKYISDIDPYLNEFYKAYKKGIILDIQYEDENENESESEKNKAVVNNTVKKELYANQ